MKQKYPFNKLAELIEYDTKKNNNKNIPYVGLEDIQSNSGKFLGALEPKEVKSTTYSFSSNHILYGRLRPYLNKVLLPDFEGHCSTEIIPIKTKSNLNKKFFFYWITSFPIVEKINKTCTGARMPRANLDAILDLSIPIPPLPEQQRIVDLLEQSFGAIDQVIENTEKNKLMGSNLFQSAIDQYFKNQGINWEVCNLEDHVKFIDYRGHTPPKKPEGMRLITAKNVRNGYIQNDPKEYVDPNIYDSWMVRGLPKKGDVLFTTEAPLANIAQLDTDEKVLFAQRIIIFQPNINKIKQTFLKYMLLSTPIRQRIFSKSTGATVQGIKSKWLKKVEIYFPKDLKHQEYIISKFDSLWDNKQKLESNLNEKLKLLQELKQSIQHKAFTGEIP
jgi:type I restriction enzyme S subunit